MDVHPFNRNQRGLSVIYSRNEEVESFLVNRDDGHRYKLERARPYHGGYHCTYVRGEARV